MNITLDDAIARLKAEIERKHNEFKKTPAYHGCMTEEVLGMIQALNLISGTQWFLTDEYGLTTKEN